MDDRQSPPPTIIKTQDVVDEYFKDEREGTVVETVLLEGELRKFVTSKTRGGAIITAQAKYPLKHAAFIGRWAGNTPCVIRWYQERDNVDDDAKLKQRELDALKTKGNIHENFIRYFGQFTSSSAAANTKDIRYYAIELCRFSVAALFEGPKAQENRETVINGGLSLIELLRQTTAGLEYLHSYGFIHRNIHPRNVLIAEIGGNDNNSKKKKRYMVKLSDFRCGKKLSSQGITGNSGTRGETSWIAPEMADLNALLTTATDVFILGCFFHYVLSGVGKHPFGSKPTERKKNIEDCHYEPELTTDLFVAHGAGRKLADERMIGLIKKMIRRQPEQRPDLNQVLEYFQTRDYFPIYDGLKEGIRPGLCVIINQQIFQQAEKNRNGSDVDVKALSETFLTFGYDLRLYANLTKDQLIQTVDEIAANGMLTSYASLVVCLLSHGGLGTIEGVDGQPVNVISDLQWAFNSHKCPDLINKPKIFIIQACQGDIGQRMIPASSSSPLLDFRSCTLQAPELNMAKAFEAASGGGNQPVALQITGSKSIKSQFVDVVTLWSTIEGFVSARNEIKGSPFIQSLCENLIADGRSSSSSSGDGGEWVDLFQAHLAATYNISSSGATQIEIGVDYGNNVTMKHSYWINQTPLYKSSACQKIGFRPLSSTSVEPTVYCCISRSDAIYNKLVNHIDNLLKKENNNKNKLKFKIGVHNLEGSSVF